MTARSRIVVLATTLIGLVAASQAVDLPSGPGRDVVATVCSGCHDVNRVRAGYSPDGWRSVLQMMKNLGAPVPDDQWATVTPYLINNFPERPRPPAVAIAGPVQVSFRQWPVPTTGSRPHDVRSTRDGSIWWTGQLANRLGRLDPKTGEMREYPLKTPRTGPHGLAEDSDGNIWFTGNSSGLIGKFDPGTGGVSEYKMPDPAVMDPHTLNFDQNGVLWFTAQVANKIGRLDPKSGEIKLVDSPTPNSHPYGIVINSRGVPVYVEFAANKVATVDPDTMAIREYVLPDPAARPRRLALASDDIVYYADYARGYLGRLDLKTGRVKEWPSPSGPNSRPYGMAFTKGAIWYSESSAKPNTAVRFDPATEKFQSWTIPGGGDIVRNMDVTGDGNLAFTGSLVNTINVVEIK